MNSKVLRVIFVDGGIRDCTVELEGGPQWILTVSGAWEEDRIYTEGTAFRALCALRIDLEKIQAQALCNGARVNVWPSGMSSQMWDGEQAYINQLNKPISGEDLVNIFEYAPPEAVVTLSEQENFHRQWAKSFRSKL